MIKNIYYATKIWYKPMSEIIPLLPEHDKQHGNHEK